MTVKNKAGYTNKDIKFLNKKIWEFDIRNAGLSVIKSFNLLPEKEILHIESLPKFESNIYVGKLRYNKEFSNNLSKYLRQTVSDFITINNILDEDILSIKNDAVFICSNTNPIKQQTINNIFFKLENIFTSYYNLNNIEFYYKSDKNILISKGINETIFEDINTKYFVDWLKLIFRLMESSNKKVLLKELKDFQYKYLNRLLPIHYYCEFKNDNMYRYNDYYAKNLEEDMKNKINIEYNYISYILPLIKIVVGI